MLIYQPQMLRPARVVIFPDINIEKSGIHDPLDGAGRPLAMRVYRQVPATRMGRMGRGGG